MLFHDYANCALPMLSPFLHVIYPLNESGSVTINLKLSFSAKSWNSFYSLYLPVQYPEYSWKEIGFWRTGGRKNNSFTKCFKFWILIAFIYYTTVINNHWSSQNENMAAVICDLIGDLCRPICSGVSFGCREVCKSPFLPYLALTFALNTPGVVYGLRSIASGCGDLKGWLLPNAFFCLLHMIAAYYVVNKIREPSGSNLPTNANDKIPQPNTATTGFSLMANEDAAGEENSFQRIKHIVCYGESELTGLITLVYINPKISSLFFLQTKTWRCTSLSSSYGLYGCQWEWSDVLALPTTTVTIQHTMWTFQLRADICSLVSLVSHLHARCVAWRSSANRKSRQWTGSEHKYSSQWQWNPSQLFYNRT